MANDPTPTLTAEQRTDLIGVANAAWEHGAISVSALVGEIEETIARMVADAEQRGRAEVSAAVEVVWPDPFGEFTAAEAAAAKLMKDAIRARLTDPAAAVARIKAEALRDRADRIGGDA